MKIILLFYYKNIFVRESNILDFFKNYCHSDRMDNITDEFRNKVYDDLCDTMIAALGSGQISDEEATISSKYILDNLDGIKSTVELETFLANLTSKWDIYKSSYQKIRSENVNKQDEQKLQEVTNKLSQLIH